MPSVLTVVLDVIWYGVALSLGLAVLMLCLAAFSPQPGPMELGLPVSFDLAFDAARVASPALTIEGAQLADAHALGVVRIPVQRGGLLFSTIAVLIVLLALGLWALSQPCAVIRTVRDGRPFVAANVARIRWVGVSVILGELAVSVSTFLGTQYTMASVPAAGIAFASWPSVDMFAIVHGLVIVAIAEAFKAGARLEEDQSLTV